ncbi:MAG TPA: hypothetical protein PKA05_21370 [Roseiflexaceae bacterium]|nr:hypothetical protein [Roseiflexaceae bacterium]HMP42939.1 hypothetical protein [Roseiflexaceae bacterium]
MKLFRGLSRTDYQDVLRAIGLFIDEHGYTDVRIIEIDEGLVLQGRVANRREIGQSSYDTVLITEDDIKAMVRDAAHRRGQKPPAYST